MQLLALSLFICLAASSAPVIGPGYRMVAKVEGTDFFGTFDLWFDGLHDNSITVNITDPHNPGLVDLCVGGMSSLLYNDATMTCEADCWNGKLCPPENTTDCSCTGASLFLGLLNATVEGDCKVPYKGI